MKLFRWILSNLFLVLVVIALVYTYVYWGNLFGEKTPAGKAIAYLSDEFEEFGDFVEAVKAKNASREQSAHARTESQQVIVSPAQTVSEPADAGRSQQTGADAGKVAVATAAAGDETGQASSDAALGDAPEAGKPAAAVTSGEAQSSPPEGATHKATQGEGSVQAYSGPENPGPENPGPDNANQENTQQGNTLQADASEVNATDENATDENATQAAAVSASGAPAQPVIQETPPVTIQYSHNEQSVEQNSHGMVSQRHYSSSTVVRQQHQPGETSVSVVSVQHEEVRAHPARPGHGADRAVSMNTETRGRYVSPEVEQELEKAHAEGDVAALTPDAVRQVWIEARKSFYRREYDKCEKRYKRVINMTKDNFDAWGELGNVYFHQGKNDEAAEAYMRAASILIDKGQVERAASLLGLMRYLDEKRAETLAAKIAEARKSSSSTAPAVGAGKG